MVHLATFFTISRLTFQANYFSCFDWIIFPFHRKKKELQEQTDPPSIPIVKLFPSGEFPEGETQQYKDE